MVKQGFKPREKSRGRQPDMQKLNPTGRKTNAENFERTAKPSNKLNQIARNRVGCRAHPNELSTAAPEKAVSAMSVVKSPECANTGGKW